MKTFCIGDIHGAHKALVQCLERSGFNKKEDCLITLGDICDGWDEVAECVTELLTIENRIDIIGNHDEWFRHWLTGGTHPDRWIQGGLGTMKSYLRLIDMEHMIQIIPEGYVHALNPSDIPPDHWKFFMHQNLYFKDDKRNHLYVHAGFDRWKSVSDNRTDNSTGFYWDRDLWRSALSCKGDQRLKMVEQFDRVFIGHTTCSGLDKGNPVWAGGVINLDTGAGWEGQLTIMDVDTEEYWQSDNVRKLYHGRVAR